MSLLDRPCAASRTICSSCGVRLADGPWSAARPVIPVAVSSVLARSAHGSGADPFEASRARCGAGRGRRPCASPGAATRRTAAGSAPRRTAGCSSSCRASAAQEQVFVAVEEGPAAVARGPSSRTGRRCATTSRTAPAARPPPPAGRAVPPPPPGRGWTWWPGCGRSAALPPASPAAPGPTRPGRGRGRAGRARRLVQGTLQAGRLARAERLGGQPAGSSCSSPRAAASSASGSASASAQRCCPVSRASRSPSPAVRSASWCRPPYAWARPGSRTAPSAASRSARPLAAPGSARRRSAAPTWSWPSSSASPHISTRPGTLPGPRPRWASAAPRSDRTGRRAVQVSAPPRAAAARPWRRQGAGTVPRPGSRASASSSWRAYQQACTASISSGFAWSGIDRGDQLARLKQAPVGRRRLPAQKRHRRLHLERLGGRTGPAPASAAGPGGQGEALPSGEGRRLVEIAGTSGGLGGESQPPGLRRPGRR